MKQGANDKLALVGTHREVNLRVRDRPALHSRRHANLVISPYCRVLHFAGKFIH